jgi:hypothetical protein
LLIDQKVQGAIIQRCVVYWVYCLLTVSVMMFGWTVFHGPPRPLSQLALELLQDFAPAVLLSFLLLPIVVIDVIRLSQSIVGPVHRLRCAMDRLAQDERVQPLAFRENDFWSELAESFNTLAAKEQQARNGRRRRSTDLDESPRDGSCQYQEQKA